MNYRSWTLDNHKRT